MRKTNLLAAVLGVAIGFLSTGTSRADVCNLKVVTDANPDYSDIGSLIYSATANWPATSNKVWAMWYWNTIARRATTPMILHGLELTDPIRQFNDYGYAMCSTVAGINCAIFSAMGLPVKYWDIAVHTVMEVEYDGKYHLLDDDFTALYTLCDGHTLASVDEIGQEGACAASGGKIEKGHIAKYHCLTATSPNGFLTGGDDKSLAYLAGRFDPTALKFRYYYNDWDLGHRYSLNLRDNEVYTRYYHRLDADSPYAEPQPKDNKTYRADPAYYVPNPNAKNLDPASQGPNLHIRGNGTRNYAPDLSAGGFAKSVWSVDSVTATAAGVVPVVSGKAGSVSFRVEGANVITSLKIHAQIARKNTADRVAIAISTDNGLNWKEVYTASELGEQQEDLKLISEVNSAYDVLVKVSLLGQKAATDAALHSIRFETITQVNAKTLPKLRLGKNTISIGTGAPSQSVVLWPDLQGNAWKSLVVDSKNVATATNHPGYHAVMFAEKPNEDAYIVFKFDVPMDLTGLTYGGRFCNRSSKSHIDMLHSVDGGKSWVTTYSLTDTTRPWDVIHYEKAQSIPKGVCSVLVKYLWNSKGADGLYAVRMEANYAPTESGFKPVDVAFTWKEVQKDYTTVERSHVQRVDKIPLTYTINVGGEDHPVMESLRVNLVNPTPNGSVKYGYSDGKDVGGVKFQDRWFTDGKILSLGKPYTTTEKSTGFQGAGDPDGKKLTDGVVASTRTGGTSYKYGVMYDAKMKPEIIVDLLEAQKCSAFRIQVGGYPWWDALKGEIKDKVEVLTSTDGQAFTSQGFVNFNLRLKDVPVNFSLPDEETMTGYNAPLVLNQPVEARYVKFRITPARSLSISQVQVLDRITYTPFDLKIALPDGKDRSDLTGYPLRHDPAPEFKRVFKMMGPDGGKLIGPTGN